MSEEYWGWGVFPLIPLLHWLGITFGTLTPHVMKPRKYLWSEHTPGAERREATSISENRVGWTKEAQEGTHSLHPAISQSLAFSSLMMSCSPYYPICCQKFLHGFKIPTVQRPPGSLTPSAIPIKQLFYHIASQNTLIQLFFSLSHSSSGLHSHP